MTRTQEVFIVLRDANKLLTVDEIYERWSNKYLAGWRQKHAGKVEPGKKEFCKWLAAAWKVGLVWRVSQGVYQVRPFEKLAAAMVEG